MNIIFLDLDGPAYPEVTIKFNPHNYLPYPGTESIDHPFCKYWKMCERFVHLFTLIDKSRDFEVVISSSWRKLYPYPEVFYDLFKTNNVPLRLHKDWATVSFNSKIGCSRADEIVFWLKEHPETTSFLIIDDILSGASLFYGGDLWNPTHEFIKTRIVMIDPDLGIGTDNMHAVYDKTRDWIR